MIRVINATELSKRETEDFKKFYAKYFRSGCVESNKNRTLSKINLALKANKIAEEVVDGRILPGYSTSYAAFDEFDDCRYLVGFITGFTTSSGMANITHVYTTEKDRTMRNLIIRKLYATFADAMKEEGMDRVQTTGDIFDPDLNTILDYLYFEQGEVHGTCIDYARKL